ncbi:AMP-binding protein [Sulfurospirillum multivorans]|uniref:Acyl-coenzyme A synthetase domain-containing protein n=2 Tax=Sulfurospirillum multivorans TaxID=66821 RepID=A0AA86AP87_SULMK|nr:AMP-binding protein [Sulfurospirillum multivorans]AHJ14169.1 acyl-coenzyme A synthetase domain-containing protein [Sulfurospirillum multivorans DSM 12446]QEH07654.1 acyl-coenzyme A synthetase domain-containing protein [Sulfurospirillum multivorans]
MRVMIQNDDGSENVYESKSLVDTTLKNRVILIPSKTKEENAIEILRAYLSSAKPILYDQENLSLKAKIESLGAETFNDIDFAAMFFTSGSTGFPTGAFKSRENIETDMEALLLEFGNFQIEKVVATVPFIHIYGFLAALLLPLKLDVDLLFKEHFLPHDLLESAKPHHLVVTTPLYIKSLLRLDEVKDLSQTIFISSTGPLPVETAKEFTDTFNTTLIQLFGSTECGSIAFKKQDDTFLTPFHSVEASLNTEGLLHVKSPFISQTLWQEGLVQTNGAIQSFDYALIENGKFQLIGRSSNIVKIAGKRYATAQIEEILEAMEGIEKALVHVKHNNAELKDEVLQIFLEATRPITVKEIKSAIKHTLGKINLPIELKVVDKISTTLMGKKCMPIN